MTFFQVLKRTALGISLASLVIFLVTSLVTPNAGGAPDSTSELNAMSKEQIYLLPEKDLHTLFVASAGALCDPNENAAENDDTQPLKRAERCAIYTYTTSNFGINKQLWLTDEFGSGLDGADWSYVRVLDLALKKIPAAPPLTVYRGTSQSKPILTTPGEVVRFKGYTSTSESMEVASFFLTGQADRMMIIQARNAKDIGPYAGVNEKEYLLPRDSHLRFDRSELKTMDVFNELLDRIEKRQVEFVYMTEVLVTN